MGFVLGLGLVSGIGWIRFGIGCHEGIQDWDWRRVLALVNVTRSPEVMNPV